MVLSSRGYIDTDILDFVIKKRFNLTFFFFFVHISTKRVYMQHLVKIKTYKIIEKSNSLKYVPITSLHIHILVSLITTLYETVRAWNVVFETD